MPYDPDTDYEMPLSEEELVILRAAVRNFHAAQLRAIRRKGGLATCTPLEARRLVVTDSLSKSLAAIVALNEQIATEYPDND